MLVIVIAPVGRKRLIARRARQSVSTPSGEHALAHARACAQIRSRQLRPRRFAAALSESTPVASWDVLGIEMTPTGGACGSFAQCECFANPSWKASGRMPSRNAHACVACLLAASNVGGTGRVADSLCGATARQNMPVALCMPAHGQTLPINLAEIMLRRAPARMDAALAGKWHGAVSHVRAACTHHAHNWQSSA